MYISDVSCKLFLLVVVWTSDAWIIDEELQADMRILQQSRDVITPQGLRQFEDVLNNFGKVAPSFFNENSSMCHSDIGTLFGWNAVNHPDQVAIFNYWDDIRGRRTPGVTEGSVRWTGNYDSCVDRARFMRIPESDGEFRGKYCWAQTAAAIKVGYCFPKSCSEEELLKFMPSVVEDVDAPVWWPYSFTKVTCIETDEPFDALTISGIVVFSVIALIVFAATVYDMLFQLGIFTKADGPPTNEKTWHIALMSFSFYTNSKKIWHVAGKDSPGSVTCLHGIRVISLFWVILGHVVSSSPASVSNISSVMFAVSDFHYAWILRADYSVDTFFFMSGLLVMYLGYPQVKKFSRSLVKRGLNPKSRAIRWGQFWAQYYFHRYWRLTPLLGLMIFFTVSLRPNTFPYKSPFWRDDMPQFSNCQTHWWTNLLYINNLVYNTEQCQSVTWYLANDMQFYWFSPVVLLSFLVSPVIGGVLLLSGVIESMISNGIINNFGLNPLNELDNPNGKQLYYFFPWTRGGVYFVGMATGYILYKGSRKLNGMTVLFGWTCSTVFALAITYGMYPVYADIYSGNQLLSDWFWATSRIVWSGCMAWIVCACHWGYGGAINHFLSHPAWRPFSRLNYAAYLIQFLVIYFMYQSQMQLGYFFKTSIAYTSISALIFIYAAAHIASATMEAPFIGLEKLLLPRH